MDYSSFGGGAGSTGKVQSSATANAVIGGGQDTEQLKAMIPWIAGAVAVVILAFAAVAIAVIRR
jgi:hypothetical protein